MDGIESFFFFTKIIRREENLFRNIQIQSIQNLMRSILHGWELNTLIKCSVSLAMWSDFPYKFESKSLSGCKIIFSQI